MAPVRPETPRSVTVVQVVRVVAIRGLGTEDDPVREVVQYWLHEDGCSQLLAEHDPQPEVDFR